jgi:hypothetical protein
LNQGFFDLSQAAIWVGQEAENVFEGAGFLALTKVALSGGQKFARSGKRLKHRFLTSPQSHFGQTRGQKMSPQGQATT